MEEANIAVTTPKLSQAYYLHPHLNLLRDLTNDVTSPMQRWHFEVLKATMSYYK